MNGEIKEILEKIKNWCDSSLDDNCNTIMYKYEFVAILDYITNLQQINKNLTNSLNKKVEEGIKLQLKNDKLQEQCKQWKENHKAVCIQRDNILNNTVKDIEEQIDYKSRNEKAIDIAYEYSQIDGEHHKAWCIDQIVRALTDDNYNEFVKKYENNGEYKWDIGIAP